MLHKCVINPSIILFSVAYTIICAHLLFKARLNPCQRLVQTRVSIELNFISDCVSTKAL